MSILKRLSTTLVSRIDHVVGEIENHEAVIQANLNDMRKKIAEAKIRLGQIRRDEERLTQQIKEQANNAQRWRERAIESAQTNKNDEAKALECIQRSHLCQQQTDRLQHARDQYSATADKLAQDIEASEQRFNEMKQKHTLMRARQSTTSALNATQASDSTLAQQLDDSFDRWEMNISQAEMNVDSAPIAGLHIDPLEKEFTDQENKQALKSELAQLLAEKEEVSK